MILIKDISSMIITEQCDATEVKSKSEARGPSWNSQVQQLYERAVHSQNPGLL